jgi:membrane protease YdiL (CAAX protease family)
VRWRWFGVCLAVALVEAVLAVVANVVVLGYPLGQARDAWVGWSRFGPLALTVAVAIPLQAAAEEVVFRGTLVQAVGAWARPAWVAVLVSSALFGLVHGLPLPGFVAIAALGLVCAWSTIRTGGLEAAIALHVLHNMSFFLGEAAIGRSDRWISDMSMDVGWPAVLVHLAILGLYGVAIATLHARRGPAARSSSGEPAQPDDLELGEGRHDHRLHHDEGHTQQAGIDPAGEQQRHAVHRPERVADDDRPDHPARQDVATREQRDEGRVG